MTDFHVPPQLQLLGLLVAVLIPPVAYVVRYVVHPAAQESLAQARADLNWRSRDRMLVCIAVVLATLTIATVSLTPATARLVPWRILWPVLFFAFGAWFVFASIRGVVEWQVSPMVRGSFGPYSRRRRPGRFWLSMAWNIAMSAATLAFAGVLAFSPPQPHSASQNDLARCFDVRTDYSADQELDACNRLLRVRDLLPDYILPDLYTARGVAHGRMGDYPAAIADFSATLRLKPNYPEVLDNRGMAYFRIGQTSNATGDFTKAIRLKPDFVQAYYNRALCFQRFGDDRHAVSDYDQAIRLEPNFVDALYNRSLAHRRLGMDEEADADMAAAVRLEPKVVARVRARTQEKGQ